jgi:N-acetylglucosamine malate deacetylase 1
MHSIFNPCRRGAPPSRRAAGFPRSKLMAHAALLRLRWFLAGAVTILATTLLAAAWLDAASGNATSGGPQAAVSAPASAVPASAANTAAANTAVEDGKLRIICFGAHPDDCEILAGGVAAKWAQQGHHVKFVSVTNGDIGHWRMAGGPLAQRRLAEVKKCAEILGIESEVLDIHDGELLPTLENRRLVTRVIREWKADLVLCHRPNTYHPDHRYVGILVQDAAYMVTVPFFCPDIPYLERNPVFMFLYDSFQKPNPFSADVVVDIDDVVEKKLLTMETLESQFFEGGANGSARLIPDDPQGAVARKQEVRNNFQRRFANVANQYRPELAAWYGKEAAAGVQHAEAFELCEYGRQPSREELRTLFPFFPPQP